MMSIERNKKYKAFLLVFKCLKRTSIEVMNTCLEQFVGKRSLILKRRIRQATTIIVFFISSTFKHKFFTLNGS